VGRVTKSKLNLSRSTIYFFTANTELQGQQASFELTSPKPKELEMKHVSMSLLCGEIMAENFTLFPTE